MPQPPKVFKNELNWSHRRMQTFNECLRQYYYHYYLKWNGWNANATQSCKHAYRLSKLTSFDLEAGHVVHQTIAQVLKLLRETGRTLSAQEAISEAVTAWDRARQESRSGQWLQNAGKTKRFLEDYYSYDGTEERSVLKRYAIASAIQGFYASKTWAQIQKLKASKWLAMDTDPFANERVYGIPMYARPDLALSSMLGENHVYRLFDWKTGRPRESDKHQLGYYALYAAAVWHCPPNEIRARLVYLRYPDRHVDLPVSAEMISDSFKTMSSSFARMKLLLQDEVNNVPLPIEHFPPNQSARTCAQCNFQELCFGGALVRERASASEEYQATSNVMVAG